jgi:poly-gamma-glutamate synthesis protein (capsule biosynthesis protein)
MGNFISNQRWRYSDAGIILEIVISKNKNTDSVYISDLRCLPTWVFKGNTKRGKEYIILPSQIEEKDSFYSFLSKEDIGTMIQAYNDTKEILTKYQNQVKFIVPRLYARKIKSGMKFWE